MENLIISKKDEIVMSLIHYFVTEEDYTPIVVRGVKDEVWLENTDGAYKIIRINSNHIHNNEQLKYDLFKTKNVMKQVKKKTLSLSMNSLSIYLDMDDRVEINGTKNLDLIKLNDFDEIKQSKELTKIFPKISKKLIAKTDGLDFIINVTNDLNNKTEKENKNYEDTFKEKPILATYILALVCILFYAFLCIKDGNIIAISSMTLFNYGAVSQVAIKSGDYVRLILAIFMHANFIHIAMNMYSLIIIGKQVENYLGRFKMIFISIFSGICGCLLSAISGTACGVGFSGALFGLMGALLYFGYHYRLYLGDALKRQIIPIIIYNLVISYAIPSIDFFAHLGGLVGGFLCSMALGIRGKSKKQEIVNGWITSIIYVLFLGIILFKII